VTSDTLLVKYGFNLGIKINGFLAGAQNKKNDDRDDGDKHKNYLLRKEIHQQLLAVKVTIIHVS
jgi:hypothetical protein